MIMMTSRAEGSVVWPHSANRVPISRNPEAMFNDHWRDVMDSRVQKMQLLLNQAQSDEVKQRLATAILKNYFAQRQMRDMQRALDKPEDWTPREIEEFRVKLDKMMKIVREGRDPEIDLDQGL